MIQRSTCSVEGAFGDQKRTNLKIEMHCEMAFRNEGSPLEGNSCAVGNMCEGILSRKADNNRILGYTWGNIGFLLLMTLRSNAAASTSH